jgi:hypothetical protein
MSSKHLVGLKKRKSKASKITIKYELEHQNLFISKKTKNAVNP